MSNIMWNQLTLVIPKQLPVFILHQRQLKHLFIIVLILALVILATFSAPTLTYRAKTTDGQQKSDEELSKIARVNQEPEKGNIYQIRNRKIREVCKKVKTIRPLFVNNRKAKVPLSYWLKNWTALTSGKIIFN